MKILRQIITGHGACDDCKRKDLIVVQYVLDDDVMAEEKERLGAKKTVYGVYTVWLCQQCAVKAKR